LRRPLCDASVFKGGICCTEVRIIRRHECLDVRIEFCKFNVRPLAQVVEQSNSSSGHLEVPDSNTSYSSNKLRTEGGIKSVKNILGGRAFESHKDVTSAYVAWRAARHNCLCFE